jgi:hypothetical protein
MKGAKFCWSFQQTSEPDVRSFCRNTLPGQEFVPPPEPDPVMVAVRPLPEESVALAPLASSNRYAATFPAP